MKERKSSQIVVFGRFVRKYVHDYGGYRAILGSPLFLSALAMAMISFDITRQEVWRATAVQTIPNLLGFSLGTYALLFTLISKPIKSALRAVKNNRDVTYLDEMNATFLHFIFVQIIAFCWAYVGQSSIGTIIYNGAMSMYPTSCRIDLMPVFRVVGNIIGVTLFLYALLLVIAASLTVYRIARILDPDD